MRTLVSLAGSDERRLLDNFPQAAADLDHLLLDLLQGLVGGGELLA